jgi:hypothetical protein
VSAFGAIEIYLLTLRDILHRHATSVANGAKRAWLIAASRRRIYGYTTWNSKLIGSIHERNDTRGMLSFAFAA